MKYSTPYIRKFDITSHLNTCWIAELKKNFVYVHPTRFLKLFFKQCSAWFLRYFSTGTLQVWNHFMRSSCPIVHIYLTHATCACDPFQWESSVRWQIPKEDGKRIFNYLWLSAYAFHEITKKKYCMSKYSILILNIACRPNSTLASCTRRQTLNYDHHFPDSK